MTWHNSGKTPEIEHDAQSSRRYKEDLDDLWLRIKALLLDGGPPGSGGWKSHAEAMELERDHYRLRAQTMYEHQQGQVWYWQGDGLDNLHSLCNSLPVVIRADQLRRLLAAPQQEVQGPVAWARLGELRIDELKSNARLIAAAPDLLDVLKELAALDFGALVMNYTERRIDFVARKARAAIAKAEGGAV